MSVRSSIYLIEAALLACLAGPAAASEYAQPRHSGRPMSYDWVESVYPLGMDEAADRHVRASIDRWFRERSFVEGEQGDFAIAFTLDSGGRTEAEQLDPSSLDYRLGFQSTWSAEEDSDSATLSIDIYKGATAETLWSGAIIHETGHDGVDQATIDQMVDSLLARFALQLQPRPPNLQCGHPRGDNQC
jgi:hypothetical protein